MKKALQSRLGLVFSFVLLMGMFSSLALAQVPTGTISGVVKDSSGAVAPAANVTLRNTETGLTRTVVSATDGSYLVPALPVGTYEVRVELSGFQTAVHSGVTLSIDQHAVIDFTLQVGTATQTVSVTGEAPLVNTTSGASMGTLVSEAQVEDLPLNGRNYVDLTLLQPGVTRQQTSIPAVTMNGEWFSANGAPPQSNLFMVDGAPMGDAFSGNSASVGNNTLGLDGIREWRVVSSTNSAEYGMRMGAQVVMLSKGGSNSFHGDAFEYLRNSALNAKNFFDRPSSATSPNYRLPAFRRNQFGGGIGGPIKKDKLFFFASYEGVQEALGITLNDVVPAVGCRGGANAVIWNGDPTTTQPTGSIGPCTQLGLNPSGPGTDTVTILPAVAPLLALYPLPDEGPNSPFGFTGPATKTTSEHYGQIRVDYNISAKDSFFARYTIDRAAVVLPQPFKPFVNNLTSGLNLLTLSDTHIFSTTLVGTYHFSFSRNSLLGLTPSEVVTGSTYGNVSLTQTGGVFQQFGSMINGSLTTLGTLTYIPNDMRLNTFTYGADHFYTKGRHSIKFGALLSHLQLFSNSGMGQNRGTVTFASLATFLQGQTAAYTGRNIVVADREFHINVMGFYAQDDIRLVPRFTLNLGLRYEPMTVPQEVNNRWYTLRNVPSDATFTQGQPYLNPSLKNFSPRVGFAWDVRGDGKTAVRGGFGLTYDLGNVLFALLSGKDSQPPLILAYSVNTPSTLSLPFNFSGVAALKTPTTIDYNMRQTHMLSYNLTVERQLPGNMSVSVAYVGSRGLNLLVGIDANPLRPTTLPGGQLSWAPTSTYTPARANPNWANVTLDQASADSWYNSLQVVVTKHLSKGVELNGAYTWQKLEDQFTALGPTPGYAGGSRASRNFAIPNNYDKGVADWSIAHAFHLSSIYHFPSVSAHGFAGTMLNGWWASGILTAQTGLPFTVYLSGVRSQNGEPAGADRPNLVSGRNNSNITKGVTAGCLGVNPGTQLGTPTLYYDPCAFSLQTVGTLGNEGRNTLIAPGVLGLDFSLVKDTALRVLGEGGKVEFRAEVFNISNHPNFSRPGLPGSNNQVFAGALANTVEAPLKTAGQIVQTDTTSRQIQFALKFLF